MELSIDHIGLGVGENERSTNVYTAIPRPPGIRLLMDMPGCAGFDPDRRDVEAVCHAAT